MQADVFKPDYRMPTMTIEEFGAIEMADAQARAKRQAELVGSEDEPAVSYKTLVEQGREDDVFAVAKATKKDRAWDDWRDNIAKGIGNTKRY